VLQYSGEAKGGILLNPTSGEFRMGSINTTGSYFTTLYANNTERMRINSNGAVGIANTITTRATLDVAQSGGSQNIPVAFSRSGDAGVMVNFYSNNSGTTSIGNITNQGLTNTQYNTSSDYRLKENILPMTGALNKVSALKPCTYTWKLTGAESQGFIAHELQEICPDAVTGEKDEVDAEGNIVSQGIDTSFLVATLTAAIQELNAKVDAQATTIATLQARLPAENQ